jgi:hypothetical protein
MLARMVDCHGHDITKLKAVRPGEMNNVITTRAALHA